MGTTRGHVLASLAGKKLKVENNGAQTTYGDQQRDQAFTGSLARAVARNIWVFCKYYPKILIFTKPINKYLYFQNIKKTE